jgi:hypothetical protein
MVGHNLLVKIIQNLVCLNGIKSICLRSDICLWSDIRQCIDRPHYPAHTIDTFPLLHFYIMYMFRSLGHLQRYNCVIMCVTMWKLWNIVAAGERRKSLDVWASDENEPLSKSKLGVLQSSLFQVKTFTRERMIERLEAWRFQAETSSGKPRNGAFKCVARF